jgi:hypothetical protein
MVRVALYSFALGFVSSRDKAKDFRIVPRVFPKQYLQSTTCTYEAQPKTSL